MVLSFSQTNKRRCLWLQIKTEEFLHFPVPVHSKSPSQMLLKRHTVRLLVRSGVGHIPCFVSFTKTLDSESKATKPPLKTNRASIVNQLLDAIGSDQQQYVWGKSVLCTRTLYLTLLIQPSMKTRKKLF